MAKKKKEDKLTGVEKWKQLPRHLLHIWQQKRWLRITVYVVGGTLLFLYLFGLQWKLRQGNVPTTLGVSFSKKYADELGVDWQDNFTALLDDAGFRNFRLMSYWDLHEAERDTYDFEILDWQMNEAAKRGAKVQLAIGERQPRWPECHHPGWVDDLSKEEFNEELLEYVGVVANRYQAHPALSTYQLENEIFNNFFGECEPVERERLQQEYDIIKEIDPFHPVAINVASQEGTPPLRSPVGDKTGFSVYRIANGEFVGQNIYIRMLYTPIYHSIRAAFVELVHGHPVFIHELQTEPWGPVGTSKLSIEEQNKSMNPKRMVEHIEFAEATGLSEMYLWGGEWWYWRMTQFDDPSLWDTIKEQLDERPASREALPSYQ